MQLRQDQNQRYLRNIILGEIGVDGQKKLLNSRILVIGAGGLGSSVIYYLAAAGIGNIAIIDHDKVELSNLQRQIIHNFNDIGQFKTFSAKEKVSKLNKDIKIETFEQKADLVNLENIAKSYDYIIDATDNFPSRFKINEFCFKNKKTLIFAAVKGFQGQVSVFKSFQKGNPCYACFNPNIVGDDFSLPLSQKGILGSVAGSIGAIQATVTINEILNIGENLVGKLLIYDFLHHKYRKTTLKQNKICKICTN